MRKKTQSEMEVLLSAYSNYSGTKKAFCSEHEVNLHVFNYWQKKLKGTKSSPAREFIKLEVSPPAVSSALSVIYPNGNRVELSAGIDQQFLATLIRLSI